MPHKIRIVIEMTFFNTIEMSRRRFAISWDEPKATKRFTKL